MIVKIARRFIKLLLAFGFYTRHYKIIYEGEMSSANKIYSSPHWSARSAIKNKFVKIFSTLLLEAKVKKMNEMTLILFYSSRMDVDNTALACKILVDTIKLKYLEDDSTKFYKGLILIHDSDLPKNHYEFNIIGK